MKLVELAAVVSAATLLATSGCAGTDDDTPGASAPAVEEVPETLAAPEVAATLPDTRPPPTAYTASPETPPVPDAAIEFPPADLPLQAEGEVVVGEAGLVHLIEGGDWLFAVEPPSVIVRIDPDSGQVLRLDLDLGTSREGSVRHAYAADALWVLGGPFRDTLVEVDPVAMRETRRVQLDDDHAIQHGGPVDTLWLSTLRGVRPVELATGEVGEVVPLEVDPVGIAVDDDAVWVTLPAASQVARIDALDGTVELVDTEPGPSSIVLANDTVWVTHPPTASISRIDTRTRTTLGVIDLDIGGNTASVTDVPGVRVTDDSVWVVVRLDGSKYKPIMIRIDADTGRIRSARTIQIDGNSWTATDGRLWFHRADNGSILPVAVDDFDDAPPTRLTDLTAPTTTPATTAPPSTSAPTIDEQAVTDAFEQFIDPMVTSSDLGIEPLAPARDALLGLLDAQVSGEARLTGVTVDGDTGTVRFDVVVEGDTVVLPGLEFVFERSPGTSTWTITEASLCIVAGGVGITCP
jgi:hypothetical protein